MTFYGRVMKPSYPCFNFFLKYLMEGSINSSKLDLRVFRINKWAHLDTKKKTIMLTFYFNFR